MTVAPDRPLHHAHLGDENPFDLIDTPWGHIERWRASTLATGTMGALSNVYDIVRTDAAASAARAEAHDQLIQHICDKIAEFEERFDAFTTRLAKAEAKRLAADAATHQQQEEELELPPDFLEDDTHVPSGDLHAVPAKEEPEPALDDDNIGDLPEPLIDPPDPGPGPSGSVYPQPVAISLNEK